MKRTRGHIPWYSFLDVAGGQNEPNWPLQGTARLGFGRKVCSNCGFLGMNGFALTRQCYFVASTERINVEFQLDTESLKEDKNRLLPLLSHLLV